MRLASNDYNLSYSLQKYQHGVVVILELEPTGSHRLADGSLAQQPVQLWVQN
jgi:hypothetical protein